MAMSSSKNPSKDEKGKGGRYEYLNGEKINGIDPTDTECGCGPCKLPWIQCIVGPKLFTLHAGILLGIYIGMSSYLHGILTTIERQFELSSSELGGLSVSNDVAILCLVIFVSYFGHSSHRPRWLAGGGLIIAMGLFICSLPHFISDPVDPHSILVGGTGKGAYIRGRYHGYPSGICRLPNNDRSTDSVEHVLFNHTSNQIESDVANQSNRYSNITETGYNCSGEKSRGLGLVWWLLIGQICIGCGAAPMFPLVLSYIDDSVRKHELTTYTAVLFISATLGPIAGLLLGSKATSLYVDFDRVDPNLIPNIPQYDPRWIGAWWLGFLVSGGLLAILSIPMFFYPKRMKKLQDAEDVETEHNADETGNYNDDTITDIFNGHSGNHGNTGILDGIKGILTTVKRLVFNPSLALLILAGSADMAASSITRVFGVKYMQNQFGLSPKDATMYVGGLFVPCLTIGQVFSAFICRRFKLDTKQCIVFIIICICGSLVLVPMKIVIGCPNPPIAGINVPYMETSTISSSSMSGVDMKQIQSTLKSTCNADCACPGETFRPVCGADGVTYISPCHAGCLELNSTTDSAIKLFGGIKTYARCRCVHSSTGDTTVPGDTAVSGLCQGYCDTSMLTIYIVLGAVSVFLFSLIHNPIIFITMRIVDSKDRSVAVGLKALVNKCLAFFPAPVYMGAIINSRCVYWQRTCGERGACWLYDIVAYRYAVFGTIVVLQFMGNLCYTALYYSVKKNTTSPIEKLKESACEKNEMTTMELTDGIKVTSE